MLRNVISRVEEGMFMIPKAVVIAFAVCAMFCAWTFAGEPDAKILERGKHLVEFGGCDDCHSPKVFTEKGPVVDESKRLSGHPATAKLPEIPWSLLGPDKWGAVTSSDMTTWVGPWGVSFATNLTPDLNTGMGSWTPEMFVKAMRTGQHLGAGRDILPPMPWQAIKHLSDDDLKALFAYLMSIKPIVNAVPDPLPPPMPSH